MASFDYPYHRTGYIYPPSDFLQQFAVENTRLGTGPALYGSTPPIEPMNSSTWPEVCAPIPSQYMSPGIHAVQSTPPMGHGNWAPPGILSTDYVPLSHSLPFAPATSSFTLQPMVHGGLSVSTNSINYVWVPQRPYTLTAHHFTPACPIEFNVDSGEPGIRLSAAFNREFSHLKERDDLVFKSNKSPTVMMRLEWPGYASWSRQVRVLDSRSVQQSISREKLAYEVAKTVVKFADPQEKRKSPSADSGAPPDRDRLWALGEGNIDLDDLVILRVENVSRGSWQPQFLVRRRR